MSSIYTSGMGAGVLAAGLGQRGGIHMTSDRGARLDAVARVGLLYALVGSTTGALIALLECVAVAPVLYRPRGPIDWYMSHEGSEFNGVLAPEAQGSATFGWGSGAGDRSTAGLIIPGDGTVLIRGIGGVASIAQIRSECRVSGLTKTAGNGTGAVLVRAGVASGGGLGVNGTPAWASVAYVGQSLTTPGLTPNTAYLADPDMTIEQVMTVVANLIGVAGSTQAIRAGVETPVGQSQVMSTASAVLAGAEATDRVPGFWGRGGVTARHISTELTGVA